MMLIVMGSPPSLGWYFTAVFLARIVMPFSRSRSLESIMRSSRCSAACAAKAPACLSMASTRVVLPWSTWATMATLRMSWRVGMLRRFSRIVDGGASVSSTRARRAGQATASPHGTGLDRRSAFRPGAGLNGRQTSGPHEGSPFAGSRDADRAPSDTPRARTCRISGAGSFPGRALAGRSGWGPAGRGCGGPDASRRPVAKTPCRAAGRGFLTCYFLRFAGEPAACTSEADVLVAGGLRSRRRRRWRAVRSRGHQLRGAGRAGWSRRRPRSGRRPA